MRIGVPKEIKNREYRVGLTPASVAELVAAGHEAFVETKAGNGIDCPDAAYRKAGASILPTAAEVFSASDMIVKVKEPQAQEIALLDARHVLFTYLHLAPARERRDARIGGRVVLLHRLLGRRGEPSREVDVTADDRVLRFAIVDDEARQVDAAVVDRDAILNWVLPSWRSRCNVSWHSTAVRRAESGPWRRRGATRGETKGRERTRARRPR
jgi:hypothetical protein